jgi:hypothetical protein
MASIGLDTAGSVYPSRQGRIYPILSSLGSNFRMADHSGEDDEITPLAEETHRAASSNRVCP